MILDRFRLVIVEVIILFGALTGTRARAETTSASKPSNGSDRHGLIAGPFEQLGMVQGAPIDLIDHQGVLFTADGRKFLTEDRLGDFVTLWDAQTLKPVTKPLEHPDLDSFSVTSDGKTVFTSGGGEVRLWDVATSKLLTTVKADKKRLSFFDSTADGKRFLTVSTDNSTLTVWDATVNPPTKVYHIPHFGDLTSAQFDTSREYLVDKEFNGPFELLRAETGRAVYPKFDTHAD